MTSPSEIAELNRQEAENRAKAAQRERERLDGLLAECPPKRREALFAEALRLARAECGSEFMAARLSVDSPVVKVMARELVKKAQKHEMEREAS